MGLHWYWYIYTFVCGFFLSFRVEWSGVEDGRIRDAGCGRGWMNGLIRKEGKNDGDGKREHGVGGRERFTSVVSFSKGGTNTKGFALGE